MVLDSLDVYHLNRSIAIWIDEAKAIIEDSDAIVHVDGSVIGDSYVVKQKVFSIVAISCGYGLVDG